ARGAAARRPCRRPRPAPPPASSPEPLPPGRGSPAPALSGSDPMTALVDKYRPRTLDDLLGQPWVVEQLRAFARNPFPCAFLFEGETGCGKTSAALALARDLGAGSDEWPELAGLYQIASGEQTGDSVRGLLRTLQLCPLRGSGWKVAVINEADYMSASAAQIWLDALENLPPRSVIVFTTNHAGK